jgi:hypothetical protein
MAHISTSELHIFRDLYSNTDRTTSTDRMVVIYEMESILQRAVVA